MKSAFLRSAALPLAFCALPALTAGETRERARDKISHVEEGIAREIPAVPRLCDGMDIAKKKVDIGGCRLYCEEEGKGVPIVLVNGGPGGTHHYFHPHFSRSKGFARIIYYDQRGCGLSDFIPEGGYSLDQAVDDLDRLRKALEIEKWVVLGHSYGGLLAQCYAIKHPDRLLGLVLVCASPGLGSRPLKSRQGDFISIEERGKMQEIGNTPGLSGELILYNNFLNGDWKRQSYFKPSRERIAQIALYDVKRYPEALSVFRKMEERVRGNTLLEGVALVWQGHMLDLQEKRSEAIAVYRKAAALDANGTMRHDQFGLAYRPREYARERIETPFVRIENRQED
jgi:pimeloyl-ACP methyl ester carboxylesterase